MPACMNDGALPSSPDYQHHHMNECIAGDTTVGGQKRVPDCDPAPRSGSQPMYGANMRWIIGAGSLLVAGSRLLRAYECGIRW